MMATFGPYFKVNAYNETERPHLRHSSIINISFSHSGKNYCFSPTIESNIKSKSTTLKLYNREKVIIMKMPNLRTDYMGRFLSTAMDATFAVFDQDYVGNVREEYLEYINTTSVILERKKAAVTIGRQ